MKVKSIHLSDFKRFTDLAVEGLPATARLVMLLGPNGCGKSSLFEAFYQKAFDYRNRGRSDDPGYFWKLPGEHKQKNLNIKVHFHEANPDLKKAFYVRTAYRNDADMNITGITRLPSVLEETRFQKLIENDATTSSNFQRLAANALERSFRKEDRDKTLGAYQDETLGEIQVAMRRLFPDLTLNGLGDPLSDRSFMFDKGVATRFLYKNLSGGEKSAFDLLLDLFIKRIEYDDTVFCIDEPEAHMNPRLQGKLLEELFRIVGQNSQLWIATHAIGMMRKAIMLERDHPGEVIFLDFANRDFDSKVIIKPSVPDRAFWENTHSVALEDLASLVIPEKVVICEGRQGSGFDSACYNRIFGNEFPSVKFVSAGGKRDLHNYIAVIRAVTEGTTVIGLRDGDQASKSEVRRYNEQNIKVLVRGAIENYLLDDEVLTALCRKLNRGDEVPRLIELRESVEKKAASNAIHKELVSWGVPRMGDSVYGFLSDTVVPLINPEMNVYKDLKSIIFD